MGQAAAHATTRERTGVSGDSSSRCSYGWRCRYCRQRCIGSGSNGVDREPVLVELSEGQSKRIDRLELREDTGLVAHLLGVQIVSDTEQPMLRAWLAGVLRRVEFVDGHKSCSTSDTRALNRLFRHRRNGDVSHLRVTRLNLPGDYLRCQMILIVGSHQLRGERLRKKVVVERVFLGDAVASNGVAVVGPIREICPYFALAGAVVH